MSGANIAVVGGGAAGMMAAGSALRCGAQVTVYEHIGVPGKKLAITGKGRCNLTNNCPTDVFLENVTRNARFLYSALQAMGPAETMALFEKLGVALKTERGERVFPVSDRAADVVDALRRYCAGAEFLYENVRSVRQGEDGKFTVTAKGEQTYDRVILATGGRSYPRTGSDGSGYRLAAELGHTLIPTVPSLVPLVSDDPVCAQMMGLSLRNVGIRVLDENQKCLYSDFGEMLFTHFGVSGPVILSASARLTGREIKGLTLSVDLKPALDEQTLDRRILSELSAGANRDFINILPTLLPSKMHRPFAAAAGVPEHQKANLITRPMRRAIVQTLKDFRIPLSGRRPIEEAIVTAGGVSVRQIRPGTMESKLIPGLYFAGEILDVDAYTGGFNLQIAFSTGNLAGKSAAEI